MARSPAPRWVGARGPCQAQQPHLAGQQSLAMLLKSLQSQQVTQRGAHLTHRSLILLLFAYRRGQHLEALTGGAGKTESGFSARSKRARQVRHGSPAPRLHPGSVSGQPALMGWCTRCRHPNCDELLTPSSARACPTLPNIATHPSSRCHCEQCVSVSLSPCRRVP